MNLKQRLGKLEQANKPVTCLAHYLPKIDGEGYIVTQERYCLKNGYKKNEIVFLSYAEDLTA